MTPRVRRQVWGKRWRRHVVVGHDFQLGRNWRGNCATMRAAVLRGFAVTEVTPFESTDGAVQQFAESERRWMPAIWLARAAARAAVPHDRQGH